MKNAMKKLMAFALVAVMLIGTLPFAASATGQTVLLTVKLNGGEPKSVEAQYGETVYMSNMIPFIGGDPALVEYAFAREEGVTDGFRIEANGSFVITKNTTVNIAQKAAPVNITLYVDGTPHSVTVDEQIGTGVLPTGLTRKGYEFLGYKWQSTGNAVSATSVVQATWNGYEIQSDWKQIGCTECGWAFASGHDDDCSQNPNKPTEAPKDETPDAPAPTVANLIVKVNGVQTKEGTTGTPNESVPVANCISYVGVNSANVKEVYVNDQKVAANSSFTLGAAGTTTIVNLVVESSSSNTGSSNSGSNNETTPSGNGLAYIYVGNSNVAEKVYTVSTPVSVAGLVDTFDTGDTNKHYAFSYYTIDGAAVKEYDDTDVILPTQTARIYVKVTESKLNNNKVYLQIFLNNNFDTPAKSINVTTMGTENGLNLKGNVKDLILENFSAKTSAGVKIDGMYPSTNWVAKFLEDEKVSKLSADEVIEMREDGYVVYNIMVTNAKVKSSSTADSSNPKTGDQIFVPVAIMAFSAVSLAAVAFYLNKKRAH